MLTRSRAFHDPRVAIQMGAIAVVCGAAVAALISFAPVDQGYAIQLLVVAGGSAQSELGPPTGSDVSGSWASSHAGSIVFEILDANGGVVLTSPLTNGSFSYTAVHSPYTFVVLSESSETVFVWGSYTAAAA